MTKKPTSLSDVMAKKATAVEAPASQHSMLMEAVNLLFERHGKPPIAPVAS